MNLLQQRNESKNIKIAKKCKKDTSQSIHVAFIERLCFNSP